MSVSQPSFEVLKQELSRLHSYTTEIGKAQEITNQVQEAAISVIEAVESIESNHRKLLEKLQAEHVRNTNEQTTTLRKTAQRQAEETQALLKKELVSLRQGAEATVQVLKQVTSEQPHILASITTQHEQAGNTQTEFLRHTLTESAAALDSQFTVQIKELQQVKQDFNSAVGKQLDGLTSITDRLQVISASLSAFRDAMNAAKFADRLESLDSQQSTISSRLTKLDDLHSQNEQLAAKLASLKSQSTLTMALVAVSILVAVALRFL